MPRVRKYDGVVYRRAGTQVWWIRYRNRKGIDRRESNQIADWEEANKKFRQRLLARDANLLEVVGKGETLTYGNGRILSWRTIPNRLCAPRRGRKRISGVSNTRLSESLFLCSRYRDGFWVLLRIGQLPAAANPAEGPPVTPRIIVSDQTTSVGDSQHRSAVVHVHRSCRVCEWLILILVDQRDAFRVADLNHRRAAPGDGCGCGEKHGELRPSLEDIDHQVVAPGMTVKRRDKVTMPASSEIRDFDQAQFAYETVPP